jgi:CDP-2,3-bis-(O-geranylgeranyl)-sn-glycerol synthase
MLLFVQFLLLILCANGIPILARKVFNQTFLARPIDAGKLFVDNRPVLGPSKTWRGLLTSLLLTPLCATAFGLNMMDGIFVAALAMFGDLFSSFVKRRLQIACSERAIGLDQIPESLLPLTYAHFLYQLPVTHVFAGLIIFILLELLLSRILYRAGIRKRPY